MLGGGCSTGGRGGPGLAGMLLVAAIFLARRRR